MKQVSKYLLLNDERKLIRIRFCAFIYLMLLNTPILWAQSIVSKGNPSDLIVQWDQMFGKLDRKIALQNPEDKFIQFIPVTISLK